MDVSQQDWLTLAESTGASQADADGVMATFYDRPVENRVASKKEGRPIYDSKTYVMILIPGQSKTRLDRHVKPDDIDRWPDAWARYRKRERGIVNGTPLHEWSYLSATRLMELKALSILTVEQLAAVNDSALGNLGPDAADLVDRARQHIQGEDQTIKELRSRNQDLEGQVKAMEAEMAEMKRAIAAGEVKPSKSKTRRRSSGGTQQDVETNAGST